MCGVLPVGRDVQAFRRRHRPGRSGPLPRLAHGVSGCPYKKVYFNHKTGKAEKCTLCYPRDRGRVAHGVFGNLRGPVALPRTGVLRRRPGAEAASVPDEKDLYEAQRQILLDPNDPEVIAGARAEGISDEWIEAAQRSPVYKLIHTYGVALPLHPEFRTVPMVLVHPAAVARGRRCQPRRA